jgi:GT2 family glycosyltransferase
VGVVDNASGDGTAEMVAREFPEVALTVNQTNAGFSAANNQAIRSGSAPAVLALNPDTRVTGVRWSGCERCSRSVPMWQSAGRS